jgi:hypothetical protein
MRFRDRPIRQKLLLMSLVSSTAAVVLVSGGFLTWDTMRFRADLHRETRRRRRCPRAAGAVESVGAAVAAEQVDRVAPAGRRRPGCEDAVRRSPSLRPGPSRFRQ